MQLKQNQFHLEGLSELFNQSDPDQFLLEKYSTALQQDKHQFEVCKMYIYHFELKKQINEISQEILDLKQRIKQSVQGVTPRKINKQNSKSVKLQQNSNSNHNTNKHKRIRRTANQITRHFQCPVQTCKKEYGSQGSLNQHIRLKHMDHPIYFQAMLQAKNQQHIEE